MASPIFPQDLIVELKEIEPEAGPYENEQPQKSTADPYLISTTTGGMENSCHSCLLGFGIVTLLIGVSVACLSYATHLHDKVLLAVGHLILFMGISVTAFSCIWRRYRKKRKAKMNNDLEELFSENKQKKIKI